MKMTEDLQLIDINKLIPYVRNARTHSAEQIKQIQASIREFGFVNPVLIDNDFNIIAGHGRIMAAKAEGMNEVPCVFVGHLTEAQKRAYILADNRLAEMAGWDKDLLKIELDELRALDFDLCLAGFSEADIDLSDAIRPTVKEDDYRADIPDEPKSKRGDLYQLGGHRLLCGNSTNEGDWGALMNGAQAVLVLTDPPYNMRYEGAGRTPKHRRLQNKIENDNLSDNEFADFLLKSYKNIQANLKDGGSFYIFYKELGSGVFITSLAEAGLTFKQELVWVKNQLVLGGAKYQNIYEPFLFGCKGDQGMMFGYACEETPQLLPKAMVILQQLSMRYEKLRQVDHRFKPDGKAQITGYYDHKFNLIKIKDFVIAYQNTEEERDKTDAIISGIASAICSTHDIEVERFLINPTGRFEIGGFDGDAGVTGRKIVVDNYHSFANVGGGAFSGKDPTKVDRSAAYKAREIAKQYLKQYELRWCEIQLSYAIGIAEPLAIYITSDLGNHIAPRDLYAECTPARIIADLDLRRPIYMSRAMYGHFID